MGKNETSAGGGGEVKTTRMTAKEFREKYVKKNRVHRARSPRSLRKDDEVANVCKSAIQAVHYLQSAGFGLLFGGPVRVKVEVFGATQADTDNILKGFPDALEGFAFKNDKQVKDTHIRICEGHD